MSFKRKRPWGYAPRSVKRRRAFRRFRRGRTVVRRRRRFFTRNPWRARLRRRFHSSLPLVQYTRHKFFSEFTITPATSIAMHQTNTNNMFDPNETGAGHQPSMRDTMAALYQKVEVIWCTVATTVFPETANGITYVGQIVANTNDALPSTIDHDAYSEHTHSNFKTMQNADTNEAPVKFFKKVYNRRFMRDRLNNVANVGSDTPERVLISIWITQRDHTAGTAQKVNQMVTYYARWSKPNLAIGSS